jgi:hypothetical protein
MRLADNNVFGVDPIPWPSSLEISAEQYLKARPRGSASNSPMATRCWRGVTFPADLLAERPGRADKARWTESVPERVPWPQTPLRRKPILLLFRSDGTIYYGSCLIPACPFTATRWHGLKPGKRCHQCLAQDLGRAFDPSDLKTLRELRGRPALGASFRLAQIPAD